MNKYNLLSVFIVILGLSLSLNSSAQEETKRRPNVILLVADDLGWTDLGYSGSSFYETPNIDALASSGAIFTNAYAASPVCSPTRSSLMCGKAPARTHNTDWFGAPQPGANFPNWMGHKKRALEPANYVEHMLLEEKTIAELLLENGYRTFFAGKWHLGHKEKYWPEHQGFETNKGGFAMGHPPLNDEYDGYFSPYGNPRLTDGPKGEYLPSRLVNETKKFIKENKDKPFFVYHPFYLVHTPLQARKDLQEKYQKKKDALSLTDEFSKIEGRKIRINQSNVVYAAMVEALDLMIGEIVKEVKEQGIADNTIIMFIADNGGLATNSAPTSNLPLKAGKGWLYEGGIREPMFVVWPGVTKANTECHEPVISTDFYSTIAEMTGTKITEKLNDGKSLVPLLKQERFKRKSLYWHYPHYSPQGTKPSSAIRSGDWKLIKNYETDKVQLFNLKNDIGEMNDLSEKESKIRLRLEKDLDKWLKGVNASMPSPKEN